MTFKIYTQPSKHGKVVVYLDGKAPTAIPPHLAVGVNNRSVRYGEWLKQQFASNQRFINFAVQIVELAGRNGHIVLLTHNRASFQVEVFKQFLLEHLEAIRLMVPYLIPGAGRQGGAQPQEALPVAGNNQVKTLADLPENDRTQIEALMAAAMAEPQESSTGGGSSDSTSSSSSDASSCD